MAIDTKILEQYKKDAGEIANTAISRVAQVIRETTLGSSFVSDVQTATALGSKIITDIPPAANVLYDEVFLDLEEKVKAKYLKTNDAVGIVFIKLKMTTSPTGDQVLVDINEECYVSSPDGQFGSLLSGIGDAVSGVTGQIQGASDKVNETVGGLGKNLKQKLNKIGTAINAKTLKYTAENIPDPNALRRKLSAAQPIFTSSPNPSTRYEQYISEINAKITNDSSAKDLGFEKKQNPLKSLLVIVYSAVNTTEFTISGPPFYVDESTLTFSGRDAVSSTAASSVGTNNVQNRIRTNVQNVESRTSSTTEAAQELSTSTESQRRRGTGTVLERRSTEQEASTQEETATQEETTTEQETTTQQETNPSVTKNETAVVQAEKEAEQNRGQGNNTNPDNADEMEKTEAKEKGKEGPATPRETEEPPKIDPNSIKKTGPTAKQYNVWVNTKSANPEKNKPVFNYYGNVTRLNPPKKVVKSELNDGKTPGYTPELWGDYASKAQTAVDVAILCNPVGLGRFNKKISTYFHEGCEVHMGMNRAISGVSPKFDSGPGGTMGNGGGYGAIEWNSVNGTYNWGWSPYWCGISTNWTLQTNGLIASDDTFYNVLAADAIGNGYNLVKGKFGKKYTAIFGPTENHIGGRGMKPAWDGKPNPIPYTEPTILIAVNGEGVEAGAKAKNQKRESNIKDLNTKKTALPNLKKDLEDVKNRISTIEQNELPPLKNQIKSYEDKLASLNTEKTNRESLKKSLEDRIKELNKQIQTYPNRASTEERQRIDAINLPTKTNINNIKNDISKLDGDIKQLNGEISNVEKDATYTSLKSKIDGLNNELNGTLKRNGSVDKEGLIAKRDRLEKTDIPKLEERIKDLEKEIASTSEISIYNKDGNVVRFGHEHYSNGKWTPAGKLLWETIKDWPGAAIGWPDHVETLLHISENGTVYTIGGNTSLDTVDKNGVNYGFKVYPTLFKFSEGADFFLIKRGTKTPYTNGIGVSVKRTPIIDEYIKGVTQQPYDDELDPRAFVNVLQHIVEGYKK